MTSPDRHDQDRRDPSADPLDGLGGLFRRVLAPGRSPEERLEEILAERRRELDEHAARFDESIADLERREELLRDSRASVERMLRMRTSDLESRETELTDFIRDLADRESALARAEADLARRRGEMGAVELKRAAVERRERVVAEREERLDELEVRLDQAGSVPDYGGAGVPQSTRLAFVPGVDYRLLEVERTGVSSGDAFELEGEGYVVARTGPSPLPGDRRRCAYLVRGARGESPPGSS